MAFVLFSLESKYLCRMLFSLLYCYLHSLIGISVDRCCLSCSCAYLLLEHLVEGLIMRLET